MSSSKFPPRTKLTNRDTRYHEMVIWNDKPTEYLSLEEHYSILTALQAENERLKWIIKRFKPVGTDQCTSCAGGRVTYFMDNHECISCNPDGYRTYEQTMEALKPQGDGDE